jgi:hypothetical protein
MARLCSKLGLAPEAVAADKQAFLQLVRVTAGNQYEDYLSIILNVPEASGLVAWLFAQLAELYQHRASSPQN